MRARLPTVACLAPSGQMYHAWPYRKLVRVFRFIGSRSVRGLIRRPRPAPCPVGRGADVVGRDRERQPALVHSQHQARLRHRRAHGHVDAVVVGAQLRQARHQDDEVEQRGAAALADAVLGDVVSAARHAQAHPLDMLRGIAQAAEPDQHVMRSRRGHQLLRDGVAAQRGFEGVGLARPHGQVQAPHAFVPGRDVRVFLSIAVFPDQLARAGVGIEPGQARLGEQMAADGALARAVHARQDEEHGAGRVRPRRVSSGCFSLDVAGPRHQ